MFGEVDPAPIDVDEAVERLGRDGNALAAQSLRDLGFVSAIDLLSSYAGSAPDLAAWFQGAAINTDRSLRLQYLAGMSVKRLCAGADYFRAVECPEDSARPVRGFAGNPRQAAQCDRKQQARL